MRQPSPLGRGVARREDRQAQLGAAGVAAELVLDEPGIVQLLPAQEPVRQQSDAGDQGGAADGAQDAEPVAAVPGGGNGGTDQVEPEQTQ